MHLHFMVLTGCSLWVRQRVLEENAIPWYSPTKTVLGSSASLWLVGSAVWGQEMCFFGKYEWQNPYSFSPSLSSHRVFVWWQKEKTTSLMVDLHPEVVFAHVFWG